MILLKRRIELGLPKSQKMQVVLKTSRKRIHSSETVWMQKCIAITSMESRFKVQWTLRKTLLQMTIFSNLTAHSNLSTTSSASKGLDHMGPTRDYRSARTAVSRAPTLTRSWLKKKVNSKRSEVLHSWHQHTPRRWRWRGTWLSLISSLYSSVEKTQASNWLDCFSSYQ